MGLYDIAYMLAVPGMTVTAPKDAAEMLGLLRTGVEYTAGPFCFRYPRDNVPDTPPPMSEIRPVPYATWEVLRHGSDVAVLATGTMVLPAPAAADSLAAEGLSITGRELPVPETTRRADTRGDRCRSWAATRGVEEGTVVNGFGAYMTAVVARLDAAVHVATHGVPDRIIRASAARTAVGAGRPRRDRYRAACPSVARNRGDGGIRVDAACRPARSVLPTVMPAEGAE